MHASVDGISEGRVDAGWVVGFPAKSKPALERKGPLEYAGVRPCVPWIDHASIAVGVRCTIVDSGVIGVDPVDTRVCKR